LKEYKELWKEDKPGYPYRLFLSKATTIVPLHWHDDPEIVVMLTGELDVRVGAQHVPLEAGEFILIKAGTVHSFKGKGDADCFVVKMLRDSFGLLYLAPLFSTSGESPANAWMKATDSFIHTAVSEMVHAFEHEEPGYDLYVRGNLLRILGRMMQMGLISEPASRESENEERFRPLMQALQESWGIDWTESKAAEMVGISYWHFGRVFKKTTGVTFTQFLSHLKLRNAERMLAETEAPIGEIAERSGFSGNNQLLRTFKREIGISPREYRKQCRAAKKDEN